MAVAFVGGTHRTVPLALRERLAFSAEQAAEALVRFRERFPGREGVLLSTCNRVEFYAAGEQAAVPPPPTSRLVSRGMPGHRRQPVGTGAGGRPRRGGGPAPLQRGLRPRQHGAGRAADRGAGETGLGHRAGKQHLRPAHRRDVPGGAPHGQTRGHRDLHRRDGLSIPSVAVATFASGVFERFDASGGVIGAGKMGPRRSPNCARRRPRRVVVTARRAAGTAARCARAGRFGN